MYSVNSLNSNCYYGTKQTPAKMQYKNNLLLSFKGNYDDFFDGFFKLPKETQINCFQKFLEALQEVNLDLLKALRHDLGLTSNTNKKRGDFLDYFNAFPKMRKETQKYCFQKFLEALQKENPDLLNKLRHQLGLTSNTNFDWNNKYYILDLSKHSAEEHACSLLDHLIPQIDSNYVKVLKRDLFCYSVDHFSIHFDRYDFSKISASKLKIYPKKNKPIDPFRDKILEIIRDDKDKSVLKIRSGEDIDSRIIYSRDKNLICLFEQMERKMRGSIDNTNQKNIPKQPPKVAPSKGYKIYIDTNTISAKGLWVFLCKLFHPDYANLNTEFSSFDKKRSETYMKAVNSIGKDNLSKLQKLVYDWNNGKEPPSFFDK